MPSAIGLRHPASASCLGRHLRLAGRCPNNSSLFPPLAAVVVVAGHIQRKDYFIFRNTGASADAPVFHFHRWGRNGKTAVAAPLSAKARCCGRLFGLTAKRPVSPEVLPLRKNFPRSGGRCHASDKKGSTGSSFRRRGLQDARPAQGPKQTQGTARGR